MNHSSTLDTSSHQQPILSLQAVTKIYDEGGSRQTVLDSVDLQIAAGERLVLLGRSGSGKSTLLNLLSGIDLATSGSVRFEGADLARLSERERTLLRRMRVGFVFQFFNLIPTLTVEENLLLPLELAGRSTTRESKRALELLDRVGLAGRRGSFPDVLSGGEQQRVAIARALVHDPVVLLADEPTGNLDEETAEGVLTLLQETLAATGKTLVMATHSRTVAGLGDRIVRVHGGKLETEPNSVTL
ncbi:MAG: ABC transporter ATP-binding protein [Thermoanaerobaculia bacterium]|nr:ABC transporter ATP-binding protein [Thermoanaerobaculia bacterium]